MRALNLPVIHAVTSDAVIARQGFLERAERLMRTLGARGAVQVRAPAASAERLIAVASALAALQEETGAWVVVTDRVDAALASNARGVQLTGASMDVRTARRIAPALAVGASIHARDQGLAAARDGAAWGVIAHVLTPPPGRAPRTPMALLGHELAGLTDLPLVAIGGIAPQHVAPLRALGFHGVAVIRGLWDRDDTERAAAEYLSAYAGSADAAP